MQKAVIKGIASYLPEKTLTNEDLAKEFPDWNVEKIYEKTGIISRAIAGPDEYVSDLAVKAAEKLFERKVCIKEEIDFLLLCTQSPDYYLPTTACLVQNQLGLPTTTGAVDMNLGCSGYIYGLAMIKGMIESGVINNALFITSETYTKHLNPNDRSVRTIFGDGAAATYIGKKECDEECIGPFIMGTDGRGYDKLIIPAGGLRLPASPETAVETVCDDGISRSDDDLYMDGADIFNFTLKTVPKTVKELLEKSGLRDDNIDYYIFHQANRFMLERLRKKIKISEEKFIVNNEYYGNTVSATIPMALELEMEKGNIKNGDTVMLVGFGVGLSWGATLIKIMD